MSVLECTGIGYAYDKKKAVLKGLSASFETGKMYAILGPSGCGKTTLLSLIGGLDEPSSGEILLDGENINKSGLAYHRRHNVAFIFQSYNLIDYLTPAENVNLVSPLPPVPVLEKVGLTKEEAKRNVLKPVSYTHLDVYKRQAVSCAVRGDTGNKWAAKAAYILTSRFGARAAL